MNESQQIETKLTRLVELLGKAKEEHWHSYFNDALDLLREEKIGKVKKRIRGAYGGMGSFSDLVLNFINEQEHKEVLSIRTELWKLSEPKNLRELFTTKK